MSTTETPATNIEKIKAGIWDIHEGVANGTRQEPPEEDNIMKGTLPRFKYVNNLGQRYHLQKGFEEILEKHRHSVAGLRTVVTDEQFHAGKAAADLRYFGVDPEGVPILPETRDMIAFFEASAAANPVYLLAIHYVIEGSNNGARFIARAVRKAYGLEGIDGTYHLDPYGDAQRDKWKDFTAAFNTLTIDDALMEEMISVGRTTFHHVNAVTKAAHALPEATQ